jgi:hypothetical protein
MVFQSEVYAILACSEYSIVEGIVINRVVSICSDSSPDTLVSMGMRRPTHLQEPNQVLLLWGRSFVFRWHLRVSSGGSGSGYLNHTEPHRAWILLVVTQE